MERLSSSPLGEIRADRPDVGAGGPGEALFPYRLSMRRDAGLSRPGSRRFRTPSHAMTRIRYGSRLGWVTLAVAWALLAIPALSSGNAPDSDASELVFWESVKDSGHAEELRAYLKRYPDGTYAVLARIRLERLMVREAMELLSDALSTARSIEDVYFRVRALNVIAEAQAAAGDARGAERAVSEALSTARRVEGAWYRAMLPRGYRRGSDERRQHRRS